MPLGCSRPSPGRFNLQSPVSKGRKYICQNPACRKEIEKVNDLGSEEDTNPRCSCGAETKKVYSKPILRELTETEASALRDSIGLPRRSGS